MKLSIASKSLRAALLAAALILPSSFIGATESAAKVVAKIDLSSQRMSVTVNGVPYGTWKVSTGRPGFRTPRGTWNAKWLSKYHRSSKYNNAPMPYSVFYRGGIAIHGTNAVRRLGRTASHGCVRLTKGNARKFFNLVRRYGLKNTLITVKR